MRRQKRKPSLTPHKKPPRKKRISIILHPTIVGSLDERGSRRSEQITQDLTRYYSLLAEARLALQARFSAAKLSLILDACNGWTMKADAPTQLWIKVADGIRLMGLETKWAVADPAGLIKRLQELSSIESIALADAVERFWQAVGKGDQDRDPARLLE